jgi:hypothetical protein
MANEMVRKILGKKFGKSGHCPSLPGWVVQAH